MKPFFLSLFGCGSCFAAAAQLPDGKIEKLIEKNNLPLRKFEMALPAPQHPVMIQSYTLPPTNMPVIVPDTKDIVPIPNAMPEFKIPAIAAIPNPALPKGMGILKSLDKTGSE